MKSHRILTLVLFVSLILLSQGAASCVYGQAPLTLEGHTSAATSAAYTPDGKQLVTGSFDRSLIIWDVSTGKVLRTLTGQPNVPEDAPSKGHLQPVLSIAVRPDGRQIASGGRDNTVKLWELYRPTPLQALDGHTGAVAAVILSSDGTWHATAGADKLIKLWGADDQPIRDLAGHAFPVTRLAVNKDASQLASGDANGWIRIWDPQAGVELGQLGADTAAIRGLAFHPTTQTMMSAAENGSVKLWKLPLVATTPMPAHAEAVTATAMTADGKTVLTGSADGAVRIVNADDGKLVRELKATLGAVQALTLHEASGLAVAAGADGIIQLWNSADGSDRLNLSGHQGPIHDLDVNAKGDQIVSAGEDGTARIWRLPKPATLLAGHAMPVASIAVSADEKLIATGAADKSIRIFNVADGAIVRTVTGSSAVRKVAFRADGAQLASSGEAGEIQIWSVADGASQAAYLGHAGPVASLVFLPDGKTMVSAGNDGLLRWWNTTPVASRALPPAVDAVEKVALAGAGAQVIVGSADGAIRVFTASTGALLRPLNGHEGAVSALAAGGPLVVSGSVDGELRSWTLATGAALPTIVGHDGPVLTVAVDATGKQVVTGGADGAIRVWKPPVSPVALAGSAMAAQVSTFSNDGALVATAGVVSGKPTVVVRDKAGVVKATIIAPAVVRSLAFNADNTQVLTGCANKATAIWKLTDVKEPAAQFESTAAVTAVAFSANGQQAIAGGADGSIKVWNPADGSEVRGMIGHQGAVASLVVRGTTLLSGSADKTVRQWNLANGAAVRSIAHGAAVAAVSASANGQVIASVGGDKLVKLWNGANGAALGELAGHADLVRNVTVSGDGLQVLSLSTDGMRLWNAAGDLLERFPLGADVAVAGGFSTAGTLVAMDAKHVLHVRTTSLIRLITGHEGAVNSVAFDPSGKNVVSCGEDKTARMWSVADGKLFATFAGATAAVSDLAVSADGKLLAAAGADASVRVWQIPAGVTPTAVAATQTLSTGTPAGSVAFSPDGTRLAAGLTVPDSAAATAGQRATVLTWDVPTGLPLENFAGHTASVHDVAFLSDTSVVSGGADKTTVIRTFAATRVVSAAEGAVVDLSISTDGSQLATASDKVVKLWNATDGGLTAEASMAGVSPISISLRGDKTQLAAVGSDDQVYLWPLTAQGFGAVVKVPLAAAASRVRHDATGERLAITSSDRRLLTIDAATGDPLEYVVLATVQSPTDVAFLPSGQGLAACGGPAALIQPLSLAGRLVGHDGAVTAVRFLPDGASVITAGSDKTIRRWGGADGKSLQTFAGAADAITSAAISGNGAVLVAGGADQMLRTWDLAATTPVVQPTLAIQHAAPIHAVAASADGSRLASASKDGVLRVMDNATGRELQRFTHHQGAIESVAMSAAGDRLASGGVDKIPQVASVSVEKLIVASESALTGGDYLADGSAIAVTGDAMQVKLWLLDGTAKGELAGVKAELNCLAIRADGMQVGATDVEGRIHLWNPADGTLQHVIETGAAVNHLAFSADSTRVAVAAADNKLKVYGTEDAQPVQEQTSSAPLHAVSFLNQDKDLLTGSQDNSVLRWQSASPMPVASLDGHTGPVTHLAYSIDGTVLVSSSVDGSVRSWNIETGEAIRSFAGHTGAVYAARLAADAKQVVSCGADGTCRLWNAATGALIRQMAADPKPEESDTPDAPGMPAFLDVAVSPDGLQAAAAGQDGVVRVWNLANGQAAQRIPLPGPAYRLEYVAAGQLLAAGHAGNITIWNTANAAQIHAQKASGVAYSAAVQPTAKQLAVPCADGKVYLLTRP